MSTTRTTSPSRMTWLAVLAVSAWISTAVGAVPALGATRGSDDAIVQAGLLTLDDLPAGWKESARSSDDSGLSLSKYGKECAQLQKTADKLKKARTAHGKSPDFKRGSTDEIANSAATYPSTALTKSALAFFRRPAIPECLQKALQAQLDARAKASSDTTFEATFNRLAVPEAGDESMGYEMQVAVKSKGLTLHLVVDYQLVRVGSAGMTFTFQGEGSSPMLDNQDLVQAAVARVEDAQRT